MCHNHEGPGSVTIIKRHRKYHNHKAEQAISQSLNGSMKFHYHREVTGRLTIMKWSHLKVSHPDFLDPNVSCETARSFRIRTFAPGLRTRMFRIRTFRIRSFQTSTLSTRTFRTRMFAPGHFAPGLFRPGRFAPWLFGPERFAPGRFYSHTHLPLNN